MSNPDEATETPPPTTEEFLAKIADALGAHFRVVSDGIFHWATPFTAAEHARYAEQAAYALARVGQTIPGLVTTPPAGGWPAVLFSSTDEQLAYDGLFGGGNGE